MDQETKQTIRNQILSLRRALTPAEVERRSRAVEHNLFSSLLLSGREVIALYAAADGEVRTRPWFERLVAEGRTVVLPRLRGRGPELDFFAVTDWDALRRSERGIPEPEEVSEPVAPERLDFVAVPGVAFDARGGRLGYGRGCYDRVLPRLRPGVPAVGVGYDFQLVPAVPIEAHDAILTAVAIERALVFPGRREDE
jgi:5-formyltetrahydrofolate cyclo-ligase